MCCRRVSLTLRYGMTGGTSDSPLTMNILLPSLTSLTFGSDFNEIVNPGVLPENLLRLRFHNLYNQPVSAGVLPNRIRDLHFGSQFNQPLLPGVLPVSLIRLCLGWDFDQPLAPGVLSKSLSVLLIGGYIVILYVTELFLHLSLVSCFIKHIVRKFQTALFLFLLSRDQSSRTRNWNACMIINRQMYDDMRVTAFTNESLRNESYVCICVFVCIMYHLI